MTGPAELTLPAVMAAAESPGVTGPAELTLPAVMAVAEPRA
jgi:hypothetical protein